MKKRKLRKEAKATLVILLSCCLVFLYYLVSDKDEKPNTDKKEGIVEEKKQQKTEKEIKYKVMLDAGHGGYDPGCVSESGATEKGIVLPITMRAGEILEQHGIAVEYTRTSDDIPWENDNATDLIYRSELANESDVELFVSIHINFIDENPDEIKGNEVWYSEKNTGSMEAAEYVLGALADINYTDNRGLHSDATTPLSVLYYNRMPSILVELGFLSNPDDEKFMTSKKGQEAIANGLAQGVIEYIQTLES